MPAQPARSSKSERKRDPDATHDVGGLFGVVYVNEVAQHTLFNVKNPQFPVGSVIVREKLARELDTTPQLLVAMVKRERGFNAKANDWEFLLLDGAATQIRHREKTGSCQACHVQQKQQSDFVFRTYLPEEVRLKQQ